MTIGQEWKERLHPSEEMEMETQEQAPKRGILFRFFEFFTRGTGERPDSYKLYEASRLIHAPGPGGDAYREHLRETHLDRG